MLSQTNISIVLLTFFLLCGCTTKIEKDDASLLKIPLKKEIGNHRIFDSIYTNFHFKSSHESTPKFYKYLTESSKGLPEVDTGIITNRYSDNLRFYFDLYKKGLLGDSLFEKRFENQNIDSLGYNTPINNELNAFTGFYENNQIVIIDVNGNYDFSDDILLKFDKNFAKNPTRDSVKFENIPYLDYKYQFRDNGKVDTYERKIVVYPSSNHPYTQFFGSDSLNKKLHIMGKLKDYWKGVINVDGEEYIFLCQGFRKNYLQILIKPDSLSFDGNNYLKNKRFEYRLKDTVSLAKNFYVLDSFLLNESELKLKRLSTAKINFGFRLGEKINDLRLEDLGGDKFSLSEIKGNKKYILLDFWGTWCPPCIESTPKLKEIYELYSDKLEILGIAFDSDQSKVGNYVGRNNINWKQAFVSNKYNPNSIVNRFRINYYPTFLLINDDYQIVMRSIGLDGLSEIENFLINN